MFIIANNEASYIEGNLVETTQQLPLGIWGIGYKPMSNAPYFYKIENYKTTHGKVYGNAEQIVKHVIEAYKLETEKNLGALFSGEKGLGKSFTIRLLVEQLQKEYPVIIINDYNAMLPNVLGNLSNCVIVLDEFEKMFRNNNKADAKEMTPQESLLTILDGTKSISHNLYLLSVNEIYKLNENLISRPGRIRYHFSFDNISKDVVRDYCLDNLCQERHKEIENVIDAIANSKVQSLDIVQALVKEMNWFKTMSVQDIVKILNISENKIPVEIEGVFSVNGHLFRLSQRTEVFRGVTDMWFRDMCHVSLRIKDVDITPTNLLAKVNQWDFISLTPKDLIDPSDPFWEEHKNDEGEIYIDNVEKFKIDIINFTIKRIQNWSAY